MALDTGTATADPARRLGTFLGSLGARLRGVLARFRRDGATAADPSTGTAPREQSSLLRRARPRRRFSPLTRRLMLLNIVPVVLLGIGAVFLSDYEDELIDAELASLLVQGEMVAAGIGEVAVIGGETTINRLDAESARQLLIRLVRPTGVRARLFGETGELLGDSAQLMEAGRIHVRPLPPPDAGPGMLDNPLDRLSEWIARRLSRSQRFPDHVERVLPSARDFPEAQSALRGFNASAVRVVPDGSLILSAAVPVQRYKQVLGALVLTRDNRSIAASLREVRYDLMIIAVAALGITVLFSLYIAGTITQPVVRLARAADAVRLARGVHEPIPDLGRRGDEIGDLNDSLTAMTEALGLRIDAIESFAADVAHELKNPLTSLRSALELVARPDLPADRRETLMSIVMSDIDRLNRLISDISDASRLDAELMRGAVQPVELASLLEEMVRNYTATLEGKSGATVELRVNVAAPCPAHGHDGRYSQVFRNVIDNALSFSPPGARVVVELARDPAGDGFLVTVDDEGPGIPEDNLESIFNRFYSERPSEHFGKHSGLGLSICRQIVETYGGSIAAANRRDPDGAIRGARFSIRVPAAQKARG